MSPEQATARRDVDGRSDVYSLGCVLYEMLAGEPPFTGVNAHAVVARVMAEAPRPLNAVRPSVPPHVEHAVRKALEKLPADRFATAQQFAAALTAPAAPTVSTPAVIAEPGTRRARHRERALWALPWGLTLFALGTLLGAGAMWWGWGRLHSKQTVFAAPARFTLPLSPAEGLSTGIFQPVALSPDGRSLVYVGSTESKRCRWTAAGRSPSPRHRTASRRSATALGHRAASSARPAAPSRA
jgi:serine/threonine-protein kinase